jgi:phytoene dehydrogenase-like protein
VRHHSSADPVVVVGAGLSGLACARAVAEAGRSVLVVENSDGVGGRVRTDDVEGFRLDRGFQVFFTAYPEARRVLDFEALRLHRFEPGALVRVGGRFHRIVDPLRSPLGALAAVGAPVGSLGDKLRVLTLRRRAVRMTVDEIFGLPECSISDELAALGFSPRIVSRFFRPLLGGIFLDTSLGTTNRMFYFVYKMLAEGHTTVPAGGMQAIPEQLAARLPAGAVRLGCRVSALRREGDAVSGVVLDGGHEVTAAAVVVATNVQQAAALTEAPAAPAARSVACVYFATPRAPYRRPILALDGEGTGPVLNLTVPSRVAPGYAPPGQELVSATVVGAPTASDQALEDQVRRQLSDWFGAAEVGTWRALRTYRIPWAQFDQSPGASEAGRRNVRLGRGLYVCGDHVENASINGALVAGRRAAEAVLEDLAAAGSGR